MSSHTFGFKLGVNHSNIGPRNFFWSPERTEKKGKVTENDKNGKSISR